MDAFIGSIMAVGFNYAPRGWAFCNGQTMSIAANTALFSLLGTTYGGDGQVTFQLPNLGGRVIAGSQGPGLGVDAIGRGEMGGSNAVPVHLTGTTTVALTAANMPAHTHTATMSLTGVSASTTVTVGTGTNGVTGAQASNGGLTSTANGQMAAAVYLPANTAATAPVTLGGVATALTGAGAVTVDPNTGGGNPLAAPVTVSGQVETMAPYLGLNYIICIEGIYPSRN